MGHQSYVLLCTETCLSKHPVVLPKSSCNVHLLRSLWLDPTCYLNDIRSIINEIPLGFEFQGGHSIENMYIFFSSYLVKHEQESNSNLSQTS